MGKDEQWKFKDYMEFHRIVLKLLELVPLSSEQQFQGYQLNKRRLG
jgi:hypothetical protein